MRRNLEVPGLNKHGGLSEWHITGAFVALFIQLINVRVFNTFVV